MSKARAKRTAVREGVILERSNHPVRAASRLRLEPKLCSAEYSSPPAGKAYHLVVVLVEQILDPQYTGKAGASGAGADELNLGGQVRGGVARELHPLSRKLVEVHIVSSTHVDDRAPQRNAVEHPATHRQLGRVGGPPDQALAGGERG